MEKTCRSKGYKSRLENKEICNTQNEKENRTVKLLNNGMVSPELLGSSFTCLTQTLYMRVHAAFNTTRDSHVVDNLLYQDIQTLTSKSKIMKRGKFQLAHFVISLPLTLFRFH